MFFAALYYLVSYTHGDLDFDPVTGIRRNIDEVLCAEGVQTFAGFLLLSVEAQTSIGFGNKYPTEECPEAVFLLTAQVVVAIGLESIIVAILYAKMSRPSGRTRSLDRKFSRRAVVCRRDGRLCLVWRVADEFGAHAIGTLVQAFWFVADGG